VKAAKGAALDQEWLPDRPPLVPALIAVPIVPMANAAMATGRMPAVPVAKTEMPTGPMVADLMAKTVKATGPEHADPMGKATGRVRIDLRAKAIDAASA
jgi:hypothetical protein